MTNVRKAIGIALSCFATIAVAPAQATGAYPSRPVKLIVPFSAGGVGDVVARVLAQKASVILRQPVVIDNVPGANSIIGTQVAAHAAPDGYTVLQMTNTNVTIPFLRKSVPFNWEKDFTPVVGVGEVPRFLAVPSKSNVRSIDDLIALSKSTPGGLFYGSGSAGTLSHLLGAALVREAKMSATHVPFKGASPLTQAALDPMYEDGSATSQSGPKVKVRVLL